MANIYEGMNVRQKLAKARLQFLNQKVKKSGKNMHLEFKYFELEDIVPPAIRIFARVGLTTDIDFTDENGAVMRVYNTDNSEEAPIEFRVPYREVKPIVKVKASYPDADISGGYYGSVTYKLNNLISKYEIRDGLLKEFEDKRTPLVKSIIARKNDLISGIKSNYANVIANVQNMKNAKLAMEYLTGLGFDLTSLIEEDKNPVTTALAVEVDTRFLFIGGKKDEME